MSASCILLVHSCHGSISLSDTSILHGMNGPARVCIWLALSASTAEHVIMHVGGCRGWICRHGSV